MFAQNPKKIKLAIIEKNYFNTNFIYNINEWIHNEQFILY